MKTLGIDLSADPAKTGASGIDWSAGTVAFVGPAATDNMLVAAAVASDMTAIDVPLGRPDDFVDAVVTHHHLVGLTSGPADEQVDIARREGWFHVPTAGVAEIAGAPAGAP